MKQRPVPLVLAVIALLLGTAGTSYAQTTLTLHFGRPELTARTGAVQAVSTGSDRLVPYAEAQVLTRLAHSSFGLAAHGGLSYERNDDPFANCPIGSPCVNEDVRLRYLNFTSGLRFGKFPKNSPVDVFVGMAAHAVRRFLKGGIFGDRYQSNWRLYPTVQAGVDVQFPLSRRFDIGAGVVGFLPVYSNEGEGDPLEEEDMSRLGVHLNVRYDL